MRHRLSQEPKMNGQTSHAHGTSSDAQTAISEAVDHHGIMGTQQALNAYRFPTHRLKRTMDNPSKTPLVLVCCGSFSPVTCLHLRMLEMAVDYVKLYTKFEVIGGYISPVSSAYVKPGLESAQHRLVDYLKF
jgi:nicotinamide mononucleotide adenylyltransferase